MTTKLRAKKLGLSQKVTATGDSVRTVFVSPDEMWKLKREKQRQDIEGLKAGTLSPDNVNWFAGGVARRAKITSSLF